MIVSNKAMEKGNVDTQAATIEDEISPKIRDKTHRPTRCKEEEMNDRKEVKGLFTAECAS